MIEILVSLVLLSLILISLDQFNLFYTREALDMMERSMALDNLETLIARLRIMENYRGLDQQILEWQSEVKATLPKSKVSVQGYYPHYQIKICWKGEANCQQKKCLCHWT